MTAYFVSDLHLSQGNDENARRFIRFTEELLRREQATHLFLVGDIFDLWIGSHTYFQEKFAPVIEAVRKVAASGIEVHFFEGNHDLHLAPFWTEQVGVRVHGDVEYFKLDGTAVRVEHGDLINPDDRGYLFLRAFLRHPLMRFLARHLPSRWVARIGERASQASRTYTSTAKELPQPRIRELIRTHAEKSFHERPFDLIITGHVHVQDDVTFSQGERRVRSVNLGSWYDSPRAFLLSRERAEFVALESP